VQELGELRATLRGPRRIEDELQVEERRPAERVLLGAIGCGEGGHEAVGVPVPGQQL